VRPSGLACYVAGKLLFGKISVRRGDLISFLGGAAILPAWCTRGSRVGSARGAADRGVPYQDAPASMMTSALRTGRPLIDAGRRIIV
jgi:hypothetical protein